MRPQTILITGAGTGIGRDAAFALARRGHRVTATTETDEQAVVLRAQANDEKLVIDIWKLDIREPEDCARIGEIAPDVIFANAAIGESGPLSEIPLERVEELLRVNVIGTLRTVQAAVAPMIVRKSGRVIITSSIAGRLVFPFFGPYHMTKFAVEAMGDALRLELAPCNIRVSLIEPGLIYTGFNERMAVTKYTWLKPDSIFAKHIERWKKSEEHLPQHSYTTKSVVAAIIHAVESPRPRARYVAPWGPYATSIWLFRLLPAWLQDWQWSGEGR